MARVVVGGEVALELLGEAPQQLYVGVVGVLALAPLGVVPALGPEQDRRDDVADDVRAVGVGRSLDLLRERTEERRDDAARLLRDTDGPPSASRQEPA